MRISPVIRVRGKRLLVGLVSVCFTISCLTYLTPGQSVVYELGGRKTSKRLTHLQNDQVLNSGSRTVVILYTNQRSGSTFLGEIFNRNPAAFYIFEPLLPFTTNCQMLEQERVELLTELSQCEFGNIRNAYQNAFKITHYPDKVTKCLNNTICFLSNQQGSLLTAYANACSGKLNFNPNSTTCGLPLQSKYLNKICEESNFTVFKVLRVCSLESLEIFYSHLKRRGYQVYFIHLVRDPRAVMSSRLDINLDGVNRQNIGERAGPLCDRYMENLRFAEIASSDSRYGSFIADDRYIRVRFEDVAFDSVNVAQRLYRFIGKQMPPDVEQWIEKSHTNIKILAKEARKRAFELVRLYSLVGDAGADFSDLNAMLAGNEDPYSTIRDPSEVLGKWRKSLSFDLVSSIQKNCEAAMRTMGYRIFSSHEDMVNLTLKYY